jgi:hypothetical protein
MIRWKYPPDLHRLNLMDTALRRRLVLVSWSFGMAGINSWIVTSGEGYMRMSDIPFDNMVSKALY